MNHVLLVCGSTDYGSATARMLRCMRRELVEQGHHATSVSLGALDPATLRRRYRGDAAVAHSIGLVRMADALVLGTPVHDGSCSAALRDWLEMLPRGALAWRRVITASCGHSPGARGSVDGALRTMLAAMGADHIEPGLFCLDGAPGAAAADAVARLCALPTTSHEPLRTAQLVSVG